MGQYGSPGEAEGANLMASQPDISVVMGVYNDADLLPETIDSVLAQRKANFEFIIVNDGSTDNTASVLAEYAAQDPRIRIISQENGGLTKALVRGCGDSRGRYVGRQDAGDISLPQRLSSQYDLLQSNQDLAFVSCWTEFYGPDWEYLYTSKGTGRAHVPVSILDRESAGAPVDGPTSHPSVMFRRQAYMAAGGYREQFYYGQDWDLWYRLAEQGSFQIIDKVLYKARFFPSSLSMSARDRQVEIARLSRECAERRLRGDPEQDVLKRAAAVRPVRSGLRRRDMAAGLYFIGEALRRNGSPAAGKYLTKALLAHPSGLKIWWRLLQHMAAVRK